MGQFAPSNRRSGLSKVAMERAVLDITLACWLASTGMSITAGVTLQGNGGVPRRDACPVPFVALSLAGWKP
jgi:hypothetical protein